MTEVTTYQQQHHFGSLVHRPLAPAPGFQELVASRSSRDMTYHHDHEGYYAHPGPLRQPLATRSPSVSSTSSSTSYSVPYNSLPAHHAGTSRTVSPASGISDTGMGTGMYPRSYYPALAHEHSHAFRAPATPLPSQILQAQAASPLPLYPPFQASRQIPRLLPYDGYPVGALHQQPPPPHYETWAPMCPTFPPTSCHSSPAATSYQTPPRTHRQLTKTPDNYSGFMKGLKSLNPEIIAEIRKHVTWVERWKVYAVNKWFWENFHPDNYPDENARVANMLNAEKNEGRDECEDSGMPVAKKSNKGFQYFGCYHCFRFKGFQHFESQKHGNSVTRDDDDAEERAMTPYSAATTVKAEQSCTPPSSHTTSPAANPHYDPSLTRSSLKASSTAGGKGPHRASSEVFSDSHSPQQHPRRAETWGQRRYCVECGLKKGFYLPGDLIELHRPSRARDAIWVCRCWKLHNRLDETQCLDCNSITPLSVPK